MLIARRPLLALLAAAVTSVASSAFAHFPFIAVDTGGATGKLLMSETLEPDNEVAIDLLAGAKLTVRDTATGRESPVTATKGEHVYGLALPGDANATRLIYGTVDLGVQQRGNSPANLLVYYTKAISGDAFDTKSTLGDAVPVELIPVRDEKAGVRLKAIADGKPIANSELTVVGPDGVQDVHKTDEAGLSPAFEAEGRYAAWVRSWKDEKGDRDGKAFVQRRNYATLVFDYSKQAAPAKAAAPSTSDNVSLFAKLPEPSASFGAVGLDGYLYVYGGHITDRHEYSTASVSGQFHRLNLAEPTKWETLPGGPHLQGLNIAAHGGKIYRVGGMQPKNDPGQPTDNWSSEEAARFDAKTGQWEALPSPPTPRSSHDVAVVGEKLYVMGGWQMRGATEDNVWIDTMDVLDLAAEKPTWSTIPQKFQRRALIVAVQDTKIYAMGGFDSEDMAHTSVDVFDTATGNWSEGPAIPGSQRNGFSPAACTIDGRIILSVGSGELYRLSADGSTWEQIAKATPRIVHRLIPYGDRVLIVGGAIGPKMTDLIESVQIPAATAQAANR